MNRLPPSNRPRFQYSAPTEGLRFARTARQAFGHNVHFERKRNPDWIVAFACVVGVVVFAYLVATGAA
jgi:hypothetical protein